MNNRVLDRAAAHATPAELAVRDWLLQMNAIRDLHVPGISTTAFTATFIDLVSGLVTWSLTAHSARRLTASMVGVAAGAFLGDWLLGHAHRFAPAVPVVVTAVVIAIAWDRDRADTTAPS